jgi:hypothetical protein
VTTSQLLTSIVLCNEKTKYKRGKRREEIVKRINSSQPINVVVDATYINYDCLLLLDRILIILLKKIYIYKLLYGENGLGYEP